MLIIILIIILIIYFCNQKKLIIKNKLERTNNINLGSIKSLFFETPVVIKNISKIGIENDEIGKTKLASNYNLAPNIYSDKRKNILISEYLNEKNGWYLLYDYEKKNGQSKKLNNTICKAIKKLDKINIVHNDLQDINILYNPYKEKLFFIDFENSKFISDTKINNTNNKFYIKRCE